jgi:hypothetical protein
MVVSGVKKWRSGVVGFSGDQGSVGEDEVLEMDGGDGCLARRILYPTELWPKNDEQVNNGLTCEVEAMLTFFKR